MLVWERPVNDTAEADVASLSLKKPTTYIFFLIF